MAAIDQLLAQVTDPALRTRLREEFDRALQNKKFGLVFEEHMPECTPLYGMEIKRGGTVCKNDKKIGTVYTVLKKTADTALCRNKVTGEMEEIPLSELVAVAEFGEAIFPCLQPIDKVENAPDSELWHTLIEADNYHALQLLEYLYTGKVDCIYIDPACGSGNFLTETYLSLRQLENRVLEQLYKAQVVMVEGMNPIQVSIQQFYGIEINDFAVAVATTALWIAESQMMKKTVDIVHMNLDFLPLKTYTHIHEGNALSMDWESVVSKDRLRYIMGNPPFVGARLMSPSQKNDVLSIFGKDWKNVGNLDYVACWYKKACEMMQGTEIRSALVSTNSVTQGEAVANLWKPLFAQGAHFDFAYRTFRWDSEASIKAHVYCVIIGFSVAPNQKPKVIYTVDREETVAHINGYLLDAPDVFVESQKKPICDVPEIVIGNMPIDGGALSDISPEEKADIVLRYPQSKEMFRRFIGAQEYLNNKERWCLWLLNISPAAIKLCPPVLEKVKRVKELRAASKREATRKSAETPTLFQEIRHPDTEYIVVPKVSSERRRYIPMGFLSPDVIASDLVFLIPDASLYHFGVLTSNVHMGWMRAVCGRLKSDYRYSKDIVYNNFPWPSPTKEQRAAIEETAQAILTARALYPDCSLADLYDEVTMPAELRRAHQKNDQAVMAAYGFAKGSPEYSSEAACVAALMRMYQELTRR